MEVIERPEGGYDAHCPELSLTARGRFAEEAIDRLKEMVFSAMSGGFDGVMPDIKPPDIIRKIVAENERCFIYLPRRPRMH